MNSVVMATYNGEKFILQQLQSIANQTKKPDEVIISDDGSSDKTITLIRDYIEKNSLNNWKIMLNSRKKGFYNNFFNALAYVNGDIVYLADQDDIWDLRKLEAFEEIYKRHSEVTMIQSNIEFIDENNVSIKKKQQYHYKKVDCDYIKLTVDDMCKFVGSGYTMSFRKEIIDSVFINGLDNKEDIFKYHDVLLGLLSVAKGDCLLSGKIVDKHRLHVNNVTQGKNRSYLMERTKQKQLDILWRRKEIFGILQMYCNSCDKQSYFFKYAAFVKRRIDLIETFSFRKLIRVFRERRMYASKVGFITDSIYAIGGEVFLLKLYRYI